MEITGPFNIQFLAKNNEIKVIELNLRASRSFPFVSKTTGVNFIETATRATLGKIPPKKFRRENWQTLDLEKVAVKAPQFSFSRLKNADPVLSVEMASTGEVACFGENFHEAFLKAQIATGFKFPKNKNVLVSIGRDGDKISFLSAAKSLVKMGFKIFATPGTFEFFTENEIAAEKIFKISSEKKPNLGDFLAEKNFGLVFCIPKNFAHDEVFKFAAARSTRIFRFLSICKSRKVWSRRWRNFRILKS